MEDRERIDKVEVVAKYLYEQDHSLGYWDTRIPKQLRPKYPNNPGEPKFPYILVNNILTAHCPKCGRLIELRICQSCQNVMCYDCLIEHQIGCLHDWHI